MSEDFEDKHSLWNLYGAELVSQVAIGVARIELGMRRINTSEFCIEEVDHGFSIIIEKTNGETVHRRITMKMLDEAEKLLSDGTGLKQTKAHEDDGTDKSIDSSAGSPSQAVIIPPGSQLLKWSRFIFPKKFAEGDVAYTIIDMQREYIESIAENRKWHPKWVCIRGYISYAVCVFCWMLGRVGKRIVDAWKGVNPS